MLTNKLNSSNDKSKENQKLINEERQKEQNIQTHSKELRFKQDYYNEEICKTYIGNLD